ncbi:hypothetical protein ACIQCX_04235 [Enterobacter cancerogenus]|uniref:hypothetical protein n=1 Tax=Enterobacter cancerogenus TaxID=69218 RepID=UPI0037F97D86
MRKKVLELETTRLERLALVCGSSLNNLHKYYGRVEKILEDLSGGYTRSINLADVTQCLKKLAEAGAVFNIKAARQFLNTLKRHRQADFKGWKATILPLLHHLSTVAGYRLLNGGTQSPVLEA